MHVTSKHPTGGWLLLIFSLPRSRASQRVEVWRKLRRYGAMALPSSGYVLPANPANREKLEWLAGAIRSYKGQASVVAAASFDDLPNEKLAELFNRGRAADYESLARDLKKFLAFPPARRPAGRLARLRRRFQEIAAIDFFAHPASGRIEALLARADRDGSDGDARRPRGREYSHRTWVTRLRPGIDRVSSAWLIRRFIDPRAKFVFGSDPADHPQAIPFDMYGGAGFGHHGDDCTFETLMKRFAIRDRAVKRIAEIVHDADLGDSKFGRPEGAGLDRVLNGWAKQDIADDELLRRGMELIEGLYDALS